MAERDPSSRRTRSARATSTRASGASRRSRSSSRSGRSCRGRRRTSARSQPSRTPTRATGRTASRCSVSGLLAPTRSCERLTAADEGRDQRQLGIVDAAGRGATFTGAECHAWAGGRVGERLRGPGQYPRLRRDGGRARRDVRGVAGRPLAERLLDCLAAAQAAAATGAASSRPPCSSSSATAATPGLSDTLVDLRVDDHPRPVEELRRLHGLHEALFGKTPRDEWIPSRRRAASRDRRAARTLGHATLDDWAGVENLEERVDGDATASTRSCSRH